MSKRESKRDIEGSVVGYSRSCMNGWLGAYRSTLLGETLQDRIDRTLESHVEQSVGFIENQYFEVPAVQQGPRLIGLSHDRELETTRRSDHDLGLGDGTELLLETIVLASSDQQGRRYVDNR